MKVTRSVKESDGDLVFVAFDARQGESMEWITSRSESVHGIETTRDMLTKSFPRSGSCRSFPFDIVRLDLCMVFGQLRLDVIVAAVVIPIIGVLFP